MIVSSQIYHDLPQKDGRRSIAELHTDHLGKPYFVFYRASALADVNTIMAARVPSIDASLIEAEENEIVGKVDNGLNPLNITTSYTTVKNAHRKLIRYVMNNKARIAIKLIPLVQWLRNNYTAAQIAAYLDVSITAVNIINNRFLALESLESNLNTDDALVGEI
jgi:hypothetical protein